MNKVDYTKERRTAYSVFVVRILGILPKNRSWSAVNMGHRVSIACLEKCSDRPTVESVINGAQVSILIDTCVKVRILPNDTFMARVTAISYCQSHWFFQLRNLGSGVMEKLLECLMLDLLFPSQLYYNNEPK